MHGTNYRLHCLASTAQYVVYWSLPPAAKTDHTSHLCFVDNCSFATLQVNLGSLVAPVCDAYNQRCLHVVSLLNATRSRCTVGDGTLTNCGINLFFCFVFVFTSLLLLLSRL